MKLMFIFLGVFLSKCSIHDNKIHDNDIGKPENYILTESNHTDDCSVYQMRFKSGEYIFRFALSGPCKELTRDKYIQDYKNYLTDYRDSMINRRGYITLNYYSFKDTNNLLVDSIISITKKNFNTYVSLHEIDDNGFVIKVFDKN